MRDFFFFFFNDTATTEIYTLSLHDALPISGKDVLDDFPVDVRQPEVAAGVAVGELRVVEAEEVEEGRVEVVRSEEHTSELQSQSNLVCRLLLEKKNK